MIEKSRRVVWLLALCVCVFAASPVGAGVPGTTATLANLQEAYHGEVNAQARYLACADRADAEGYRGVAGLFRAAAAAEAIHAANQAQVLRALGIEPTARITGAAVGTTVDNLRDAVHGERYERDTMYPEFIAAARREGLADVARSLVSAARVEAGHAQLFADALADLDLTATSYLVCPTCGGTFATPAAPDSCPFCSTPGEAFITVR
ncbi:MAG: ferritin family protein [Candidatus Krumholzibacteriia bacterium]